MDRSMFKYAPSSRTSGASGFSVVELLLSTALATMALAATSSLFLAGRNTMRNEDLLLETSHAIRSTTDLLLRDLRLGGACLPVTGAFIALAGIDNGVTDELISRTGLTRGDLSCVRTASVGLAASGSSTITVENVDGFSAGTYAYVRHPNGAGEFFTVSGVDVGAKTVTADVAFSVDYPATSGVYGIDERHYTVDAAADPPVLQVRLNQGEAMPFALGIEEVDIQYQLKRNCPQCDIVALPIDNNEWALVDQILLTVTARSRRPSESGEWYRKTMTLRVKPRNLLP
jgi:hypothetical protein